MKVKGKDNQMEKEINTLIANIKADYLNWTMNRKNDLTSVQLTMIEEFNNGITFSAGQKYIRIDKNDSVWGFIVNTDNDKKFQRGDILKPASFRAPARNKARGNILTGGYEIGWTGPHYL
jgi:hypothetical protein